MAYSAAIRAVSSGVGLSKSTQKGFVLSELVASLATVVWIVSIRPAQIAKRGIGIDTDTKAGHSQLPRMRSDAPARLIVPPVTRYIGAVKLGGMAGSERTIRFLPATTRHRKFGNACHKADVCVLR